MPLLEISGLKKSFLSPDGVRHVVIDVPEFSLAEQAQVALSGESGLGKTTFLHLIAGILKPDAGRIHLAGQEVSSLGESERDRLRANTVGYIFQTFNLLPAFTCLENVLLGMSFGPGADRPTPGGSVQFHNAKLRHRKKFHASDQASELRVRLSQTDSL